MLSLDEHVEAHQQPERVLRPVVAELAWPANYERRASGAPGQSETLEWPVDEWRVSSTTQLNTLSGELVPGKGPLFRGFELGVANLLGLVRRPGWVLPAPQLAVRREDRSARIAAVFVGHEGIDVTVEGDALQGTILELAGEIPGATHELGVQPSQTFRFNPQPPAQLAWLALHRDGALLDERRQLYRPPVGGSPEMGVSFEPEPDATDNSPFTEDERAEIRQALAVVRLELRMRVADEEEASRLDAILDEAEEADTRLGRIDWRRFLFSSLIEAALRGAVTGEHVRLVWDLLRAGVKQLTALDLPELPS